MRTKLAMSLVAMTAITLIGSGGLTASASSASSSHRAAGPAHAKSEHLRFMSTEATSGRITVIATGAFTAGGIDQPGRVVDVLRFPSGTLRYRHVTGTSAQSFNPHTCLITETETGRFMLRHGTGRYAGVHGSGRFAFSIVAVARKNRSGGCTHVQAPATFQQLSTANGAVSR